eukprot:3787341-Pyramimonas_sp.AAC.1
MWDRVFSQAQSDISWAQTRGPISRIPLCLARVRWKPASATEWVNQDGITIQLTQCYPAML